MFSFTLWILSDFSLYVCTSSATFIEFSQERNVLFIDVSSRYFANYDFELSEIAVSLM